MRPGRWHKQAFRAAGHQPERYCFDVSASGACPDSLAIRFCSHAIATLFAYRTVARYNPTNPSIRRSCRLWSASGGRR